MAGAGTFTPLFMASATSAAEARTGKRLALNLTGMSYWATEYVFSNLAHNASRWRLQVGNDPFTWNAPLPPMTPDGYPREIPPHSHLESFLIFSPERRVLPVQLSVFYDGRGKLHYAEGAEFESRAAGRDDVRNLRNDAPFTARLKETDHADPIRNIRIHVRGQLNEPTFRKPFLQRLKGMSALRFMDWMATNDSTVIHWKDRQTRGQFGRSERGVPLEDMIELCNQVRSEPWFTMPHLCSNEFVARFAEQVKQDLDPDLAVHVEYSNEVWNTMFGQADHAREHGLSLGLSDSDYEAQLLYYAQRTTEVLSIWENVFAADRQRIIGVYAAQAANAWTSTTILSWKGVAQHADVLAIAPYFGGSLGSPERADEVAKWSLDRLFLELEREVEAENKSMIQEQAAVARQYGLKLHAYEGGQHLVGQPGAENNEKLTALFIAANRDRRMGGLYRRHLENWWGAGGELYALFSSMSSPDKWGSWGLLENETASHPKWQAVQDMLTARY
ncbi:hypothetical protein [Neorhizobium sp. SOG26]|uniref:hypothetical protein n=1 Tax=Neorhizobium sp. SOG26 TaxID=2060726 RepID=UPI001FE22BCB|nr:hypothetical protein [Neorhizobium sp. SOG26]